MDICVVGGSGFLGSRLLALLSAAGHRLRVPTRNAARSRHLLVLPSVRLVEADIHDARALEALFGGCDAVVNLVGILNERGRDGSGFRRAHLELTEKVLEACHARQIDRLVQVSAIGADPAGPSHYLKTKGLAEQAIRDRAGDLDWVILQPSVIFGPGDLFLNRFAGLLRVLPLVFPLAMAGARFAPVHVDDVAAAIIEALTRPDTTHHTYQLCGHEVFTLREIVELIAHTIGVSRAVVPLPRWASFAQAAVMGLIPGKPFSMDNCRSLTRHSVCSEDGMAALGLRPRSLSLSIESCLGLPRAAGALNSYRRAAGRQTH